ncbi:helix-turn-helix domain-containing protein [Hirschia maritima]|uniref:helix-turn-helix domain-containing protein n=1 Tax=Hirschia maritima TaxID=1121961 RepID=UPI000364593D|nr:helix-turn-helix domain-containing protein [Hirschia maritima]
MSQTLYPNSQHDRPHGRCYDHHCKHAAWIELSAVAFKIIFFLFASYRPTKGNFFPVGERRLSEACGVGRASVKNAIDELIEKGHLKLERKGRPFGDSRTRERVVSLTRFDTVTCTGDPDLPLMVWREKHALDKS